ncbi:MAG: ribbon-helix-helix domain-containing protein [Elusimicrobiota bacterium]|nr:ribbon-helix-helix domain-containing protein [Elusimicrobiota bacterium]
MTISARLKKNIDKKLHQLSEIEGVTITKIIEESIEEYFNTHIPVDTPYEKGKDLFGKYSSGRDDLSVAGKSYLKKKLRNEQSSY